MPPKRKRGNNNRPLGGGASPSPSSKASSSVAFLTSPSSHREKAFDQLQEVFSGSIDAEVIYMVLAESDFNVDVALETLVQLTDNSVPKSMISANKQNSSDHKHDSNRAELDVPTLSSLSQRAMSGESSRQSEESAKDVKSTRSPLSSAKGVRTVPLSSSIAGLDRFSPEAKEFTMSGSNAKLPSSPYPDPFMYSGNSPIRSPQFVIIQKAVNAQLEKTLKMYRTDPPQYLMPVGPNPDLGTWAVNGLDPNSLVVLPSPEYFPKYYIAGGGGIHMDARALGVVSSISNAKKNYVFALTTPPTGSQTPRPRIHGDALFAPHKIAPLPTQKVLCLMRGLPGSGKSTLARHIVANGVIFSTDDFFMRNGKYEFNPSKLGDAHEWNQRRAKGVMKVGRTPVIIDNTNAQLWEMVPYVTFAESYGYDIVVREPTTSWKFNTAELERRNIHGVPEDRIYAMKSRYDHTVTLDTLLRGVKPKRETSPQSSGPSSPRKDVVFNNKYQSRDVDMTTAVFDDIDDEYDSDKPEGDGGEKSEVVVKKKKRRKKRKKKKVPTATLR